MIYMSPVYCQKVFLCFFFSNRSSYIVSYFLYFSDLRNVYQGSTVYTGKYTHHIEALGAVLLIVHFLPSQAFLSGCLSCSLGLNFIYCLPNVIRSLTFTQDVMLVVPMHGALSAAKVTRPWFVQVPSKWHSVQ